MDQKDLKNILSGIKTPPAGDNARKIALNLALAEFEAAGKETQKNIQGSSILNRLTGNSTKDGRINPMKKRYIYGSMATAMVVVLAATISFQQLDEQTLIRSKITGGSDVSNVPASSPADITHQHQTNVGRVEQTLRENRSSLPTPLELKKEFATASPPSGSKMARNKGDFSISESAAPMPGVATSRMYYDSEIAVYPGYQDVGRDSFQSFEENQIKIVKEEPVSTFSIDVDTSSYAFMRRQINSGVLPQKDSVRIEEMINYFDYSYPLPETREEPFKPSVTVVPSPWAEGRKLIHIGIKGYDIAAGDKPRSNLVFLIDVSGSMNSPDKLPLLKNSFKLLLDSLEPDDTVGIVVYAGAAGTVLEPTKASEKQKILHALENLSPGGSTAGAEGIRQAYRLAEENFDKDGVNRIILATDGDFNVGITSQEELKDFVERKRKTGIYLSVLGFGQGNLNDHMMQTIAQNGNGVAAYIDNLNEARKVLVEEASSALFTIAKDVKIQVEFNPDLVSEYRLIGYETRTLNREDFNNDAVDAGDIGSGHTVTAIYEITPVGGPRTIDENRYGKPVEQQHKADTSFGEEYAFLKIRYKNPDSDTSKLITAPVTKTAELNSIDEASEDTRFATAVAAFGQLLKGGKYTGTFSYDDVIELAQGARGNDPFGYRNEFLSLARLAKSSAALQKSTPENGPSPYMPDQPVINYRYE